MKTLFLSLFVTSPLWAAAPAATLKLESIHINYGSSVAFSKITDTEEDRVCYAVTAGTTGGADLKCFDRKEAKADKEPAEK